MTVQLLTGLFTLGGVAITATAALIAARLKLQFDQEMGYRSELRELYARTIATCQELRSLLFQANRRVTPELQEEIDGAYMKLATTLAEISVLGPEDSWKAAVNTAKAFKKAYDGKIYLAKDFEATYDRLITSPYHELVLSMRRDLVLTSK
jgi:hypothetical protein